MELKRMEAFSVYRKIDSSPRVAVHGQVLTKPHIVELMIDLAGYAGDRYVRVLDAGCGVGAFTIAASVLLSRHGGIPKLFDDVADCILGVEKDHAAARVCRERLHKALVEEGTASALAARLSKHWIVEADFLEQKLDRRFDLV